MLKIILTEIQMMLYAQTLNGCIHLNPNECQSKVISLNVTRVGIQT